MTCRVRFAPSPTGHLHLGGARTALFNWLLARRRGGTFILRIEDTDAERSRPELAEGILEGLQWLGLSWDEGPIHQSQRGEIYRQTCRSLLERGQAYHCFCSREQLQQQKAQGGKGWRYDGTCRRLDQEELALRLKRGDEFALRFRVPRNETLGFRDAVFGLVEVQARQLEDFVIQRSDGTPTYHLSVVADDTQMAITHVIRGADHLSNTSKHLLLFRALGYSPPVFVHLPLILGPDKKRLSKRHGAASVLAYRDRGILPGALRNYLALLGWSPGNDQELFDDEQLVHSFSLKRINKANAVFDPQKLEWMNGKILNRLPPEKLVSPLRERLQREGLWQDRWNSPDYRPWLLRVIDLLKTRIRNLNQFSEQGRAFFSDDFDYDEQAVEKQTARRDAELRRQIVGALDRLVEVYQGVDFLDSKQLEQSVRAIVEEGDLKTGQLFGIVRLALTGRAHAPGLFDVMQVLGREKTLQRLRRMRWFLE